MALLPKVIVAKPAQVAAKALTESTQELAARQTVADLTQVRNTNVSVFEADPGKVIDFTTFPKRITVTIENTNSSGGDLDVPVFNNDVYTPLPSGVTVNYSTGFTDKLINRLLAMLDNGRGLFVYGFNISGFTSSGTRSDIVVNESAPEVRVFNGSGTSFVPFPIEIAGAERNTQEIAGLFTIKQQIRFNFLSQFKVRVGQQEKIQLVFFTTPILD